MTHPQVATGDWHMEAVYEQIEELQQAAQRADSEPMDALFSDAADMALWLLAEKGVAEKNRNAARANFLTMQGAAADLLDRALTAERLLAEAREALTKIASGKDKDGNAVDFFQDIAGEALASIGGGNG